MAKDNTKWIEDKFNSHESWLKSQEQDVKKLAVDIVDLKTSYAGMAEAIKSLAEDMKDFKKGMDTLGTAIRDSSKDTNNRLLWGFLGVIAVGVIAALITVYKLNQ